MSKSTFSQKLCTQVLLQTRLENLEKVIAERETEKKTLSERLRVSEEARHHLQWQLTACRNNADNDKMIYKGNLNILVSERNRYGTIVETSRRELKTLREQWNASESARTRAENELVRRMNIDDAVEKKITGIEMELKQLKKEKRTNAVNDKKNHSQPDNKPFEELPKGKKKKDRVNDVVKRIIEESASTDPKPFALAIVNKLSEMKLIKNRLTQFEGFQLYQMENFSRGFLCNIKSFFRKCGIPDPFPSKNSIIEMEKLYCADDSFEIFEEETVDDEGVPKKVVYGYVKDVRKLITVIIQDLILLDKITFQSDNKFVWLAIAGDKGSDEFKLVASVGNMGKSNSVDTVIPLGFFQGKETAAEMKKYLGKVIDQINQLEELYLNFPEGLEKVPVRQFLGGDMKFQFECLGHEGASGTKPCTQCEYLGRQCIRDFDRDAQVSVRTEDSYKLYSSKTKKSERNNVKQGSTFLFTQIPLNQVIPPSLHISMGLAQRYGFDFCLESTRKTDNPGVRLEKSNAKTERKVKGELVEKRERMTTAENDLKAIEKIEKVLGKMRNKQIEPSGLEDSHICSAEFCLFRDKDFLDPSPFDARKISCWQCQESSHGVCLGIWDSFEWGLTSDPEEMFHCLKCRQKTGGQVLNLATFKKVELQKEISPLTFDLRQMEEQFEKLMKVMKGQGATRKRLESCWKSLGADMSAWTQNFNGNHTLKLLKEEAINQYLDVLEPGPELIPLKGFLVGLGKFQSLCVARMLTDDEITLMENIIDTIWFNLQQLSPEDTVTPKLHYMLTHVMQFVRLHGTLALTSEQGVEAMHARVNSLKVRYRSIRQPIQRWTIIFRTLLQRCRISHTT